MHDIAPPTVALTNKTRTATGASALRPAPDFRAARSAHRSKLPHRLLIVEDEPIVTLDLKRRVSQMGYQVTGTATSGLQALALAEQVRPDLVLMDIGLQGAMDGIDAAELLHARFRLPVVFLTAYAESALWQRAMKVESFGYLLKPISDRELEIAIEMALFKHAAERKLHASEEQFRALIESARDGVVLLSAQGTCVATNAAFAHMHGYTIEEILAINPQDFETPESARLAPVRFQRLLAGESLCFDVEHFCRNGQKIPLEVSANPILIEGEMFVVGFHRDISERKRSEAILLEWNQSLEHRLAERALELKRAQRFALVSEVSTGILHQLGQPLCAMGANLAAALIKMQSCQPHACASIEILRDIEADVDRLRDSVSHLRTLAHAEQPHRVLVNFNEVLEESLRLLDPEIARRQIRLSVALGAHLPPILADTVQLSQVILNLVRNACDACENCPQDRWTVAITTRILADEGIEFCVRDAGTGIAHEVLDRLFTPFFTTKTEGLGMGLRLSHIIVEAHGGRILGENNPDGIGATFRVVLPTSPA